MSVGALSTVSKAYDTIFDKEAKKTQLEITRLRKSKSKKSRERLSKLKPLVRENTIDEKIKYVKKMKFRMSKRSDIILTTFLEYLITKVLSVYVKKTKNNKKVIALRSRLCMSRGLQRYKYISFS